jgi:hypothetical protein
MAFASSDNAAAIASAAFAGSSVYANKLGEIAAKLVPKK